ncbi:hypothetical protein M422DRAFT_778385 [Sphaerobolus stellatus SS14]|uniref:Uncharacterized protein n=1 Tax=Sphaerobolus stellatus (strain SS14) TaxID=990650 RepID=A0A0C9VHI1_SPHS4|nr:hypothetical protein M422DRAFT_778385 [Sphaerobolus stellatus SS14]
MFLIPNHDIRSSQTSSRPRPTMRTLVSGYAGRCAASGELLGMFLRCQSGRHIDTIMAKSDSTSIQALGLRLEDVVSGSQQGVVGDNLDAYCPDMQSKEKPCMLWDAKYFDDRGCMKVMVDYKENSSAVSFYLTRPPHHCRIPIRRSPLHQTLKSSPSSPACATLRTPSDARH